MSAHLDADVACFLQLRGASSMLEYLGIPEDSSPEQCDQALRARRSWAQLQRNNTKYRVESDWILRNYRSLREALVHRPQEREAKRQRQRLMAAELKGTCSPQAVAAMVALPSVSEDGSASTDSDFTSREEVDPSRHSHIPRRLVEGLMRMGASHHLTQRQMLLLLQDEALWWQRTTSAGR